jgi:alkanesulfonate monooxygenase SsuD/methylene tetrahydromethanopterin reductase-like flavin-dependent oxidoreductase (luciferase family)
VHLTVCINGRGFDPGGWRSSSPADDLDAARLREMTTLAETAGFAAALFGIPSFDDRMPAAGGVPPAQPDALPLVAALIAHTTGIGLGATYRLDRAEPYNIARSLATLDRLALGRTAWIIALAPAERADRGRAAECIEVVRKLWDSWEDDAFIVDKARGLVADPGKVHRIDHAGPHFSVRGPLNVPRPTQGHPVVVMTDPGDVAGRSLCAGVADLLLVAAADGDCARRIRQSVRSLAADAGRDPDGLKVLMNVMPILAATDADAQARTGAAAPGALPASDSEPVEGPFGMRFVGTPGRLAEELAELHAGECCDGFNIVPARLPHDLQAFVDGTIPALRRRGLAARPAGKTLRDRLGLIHPRSRYELA